MFQVMGASTSSVGPWGPAGALSLSLRLQVAPCEFEFQWEMKVFHELCLAQVIY